MRLAAARLVFRLDGPPGRRLGVDRAARRGLRAPPAAARRRGCRRHQDARAVGLAEHHRHRDGRDHARRASGASAAPGARGRREARRPRAGDVALRDPRAPRRDRSRSAPSLVGLRRSSPPLRPGDQRPLHPGRARAARDDDGQRRGAAGVRDDACRQSRERWSSCRSRRRARPSTCSTRETRRTARLRERLLLAVVAPVAFVALGASQLVHAHLRAFDTSSRLERRRGAGAGRLRHGGG